MSRLGRFMRAAAFTFTQFATKTGERLSLVPTYLSHLLWLLSQGFRELVQQGYGGNAAVYACLRVLCTSVAEPPLTAYIRQDNGQPGDPLDYGHELSALIREPNPFQTEYEFWELATIHLVVGGISHWWKERDRIGRLIALWPLRPDRVGPIYGDAALGEPILLGWSYLIPGSTRYVAIAASDILTFNLPDPIGESGGIVEGFGPLQALAAEIGADNEATRFVGSLLANSATPGIVIQSAKPITRKEDAELIKAAFMREFGGLRRGQPAVTDGESTVTQLGFSLQQLEFPGLRRVSESRIAAALGVPAILAGLLVGLEAGIRATIAEQREYFAETTLSGYWRRFSDQYTKDIAREFGPQYVCRFDMAKVRALVQQTTQDYLKLQGAYERGALTKNEIREALGYEKRADGDQYAYGIAPGRGMETPTDAADDVTNVDETTPAEEDQPARRALSLTGEAHDGVDGLKRELSDLLDSVFDAP